MTGTETSVRSQPMRVAVPSLGGRAVGCRNGPAPGHLACTGTPRPAPVHRSAGDAPVRTVPARILTGCACSLLLVLVLLPLVDRRPRGGRSLPCSRASRRLAAAPAARGGATGSTRRPPRGVPATAASTSAGHAGQQVHTALAGTVTFAGRLAGRGVVVVDHGGLRTTYEPVSASVQVGDPVAKGAVIGTLQRASSHCFPRACLHWGLIRGETYLDPLTLVGAGPIRLLPLGGGGQACSPTVTARSWTRLPLRDLGCPVPRTRDGRGDGDTHERRHRAHDEAEPEGALGGQREAAEVLGSSRSAASPSRRRRRWCRPSASAR